MYTELQNYLLNKIEHMIAAIFTGNMIIINYSST